MEAVSAGSQGEPVVMLAASLPQGSPMGDRSGDGRGKPYVEGEAVEDGQMQSSMYRTE